MAKLLWTPFRHVSRLIHNRPQIVSLISAYRDTPFSIQDAVSEWKGDGGLLVATHGDEIAGLLRMDRRRTHWILSSFVVNPTFRGHGTGSSMVDAILRSADMPVWLQVKQDNPAQNLYRRHGFEDQCVSNGRILMRS